MNKTNSSSLKNDSMDSTYSEQSVWSVSRVGEDYAQMMKFARTPEILEWQINHVEKYLQRVKARNVLDLCCGSGDHSIELAKRGYNVTGLDINGTLLQKANDKARALRVDAHFIQGDMRSLPFTDAFDAIINLDGSFGFLDSEVEDEAVYQEVYSALKSSGIFVQQLGNLLAFVRTIQTSRGTRLPDGLSVIEERSFNVLSSRLTAVCSLYYPDGRRSQFDVDMRMYTPSEVTRMLRHAGFEVEVVAGELDGRQMTLDSNYFVTVSKKMEPSL